MHTNRQHHTIFNRLIVSLFAMALSFSPISVSAQSQANEAEPAGRIIFVQGEVVARDSSGSDRQLSRRQQVFVGDTIFTAPGASSQIRMVDDALISLKESTEFAIVAYQYEKVAATDESSLELIRGGFRTITGAIGENSRDNYETSVSNFATIGIRGTDYEVVITPQGEVLTGVYDGGTTLVNDQGTLDLGFGADYDFGRVEDPESAPEGLMVQPEGLGDLEISITADEDQDEEDD